MSQKKETNNRKSLSREQEKKVSTEIRTAVKERAEKKSRQAGNSAVEKAGEIEKRSFLDEMLEAWRDPDENISLLKSCSFAFRRGMRRIRRRWRHIIRERDAHNFPESNRFLIQLVLLAWSLLPMLGSMLQEQLLGRRRRALRAANQRKPRKARRLYPLLFMALGCVVTGVLLYTSIYTEGTIVTYDGEEIARVASEKTVETAKKNLEKTITRTLGKTYTIDSSVLQCSTEKIQRKELVEADVLEEELFDRVGMVTSAYCLYVDGEFIGATPYEGALEELLEQLHKAVTNEDTISCSFKEEVEIKPEYVPTEKIVNLGHLAETLYSTKTEEVTYEVKKGDTWSEIAEDHGLTNKELLELNPGYNINRLQIGEVLTLSASVPYLTVTVQQRERYVDEVMYDIEYTPTGDMYQGDYKVTSPGQYGAADMVANVTYVNGVETERTVLSSVTLREPVTEQRLEGTKERPTWHPTGSFRWPVSGRITSYFGGRKSPGGIGSTNHKGLDIAAPKGTPVYASDGGTVTYSGWMSGYGYTVRIDHGNGYVTFYAHNSRLLVSVGQHVHKGQQIAKVGSTGNSTGNHCHFEIRYNGVAKNPLNYL